ncbi:hypothetical protein [Salmonella enterica]|uniref:hypothetical protein n=1 Tax=Salmonella enterica TaxID=28901 RepID=UPI001C462AE9|nr:hypothetical protein [Salmonella enterica]
MKKSKIETFPEKVANVCLIVWSTLHNVARSFMSCLMVLFICVFLADAPLNPVIQDGVIVA